LADSLDLFFRAEVQIQIIASRAERASKNVRKSMAALISILVGGILS